MDAKTPTEKECKTCKVIKKCEDFYAKRKECKKCYLAKRKNTKCVKSKPQQTQQVQIVQQVDQPDVDSNGFTGKQREYLKVLKDFHIPYTFNKLSDTLLERIIALEDDLHSMREENKRLKSELYAKLEGKQGKWLDGLYGRMRDAFYTKEDVSSYVEDCLKAKDGEITILKERLKNIEMRLPPMSPSSPPSSFMIPCSPISPNTPLSQLSAPKSPPMRFNNKPLPIFIKKVATPTVTKNPLPPIRFA